MDAFYEHDTPTLSDRLSDKLGADVNRVLAMISELRAKFHIPDRSDVYPVESYESGLAGKTFSEYAGRIPNETTLKALEQLDDEEGWIAFSDPEALFAYLDDE